MDTNMVKQLLAEAGLRPKKGLGQHFLVAKPFLDQIVKAAELKKMDTVLEIGSGLGVLTKVLAKKTKRVVAVEKDPVMVDILEKNLAKADANIEIIQGDVLKIENWKLKIKKGYKIVANLPYYITSPAIRRFLEERHRPNLIVLMVQKEVAQRICAKPPRMNLLAVSVQAYAKPEIVALVPKNAFWPQPKVDSAIIKITPQPRHLPKNFFAVVKAGFKQPRKQLAGNLAKELGRLGLLGMLGKLGIDQKARAETLTIEDWLKLAKLLSKK